MKMVGKKKRGRCQQEKKRFRKVANGKKEDVTKGKEKKNLKREIITF